MNTSLFIEQYRESDITDVALKVRQYPDVDTAFALQQIEGWQKCRHKIPTIAALDWHYPKKLALEQCSSEEAAIYKRNVAHRLLKETGEHSTDNDGADLTGGLGADTLFLASLFNTWQYVEKDGELCRLAQHNLAGRNITVHCTDAENFILKDGDRHFSLVFADPARRDGNGAKVVRLSDCTPDIAALYPILQRRTDLLMVKLSPMLDIHKALRLMPQTKEVHVVAVNGEVKEVLICCDFRQQREVIIHAVNLLPHTQHELVFTEEDERRACCNFAREINEGDLLFEPNAAILKAGAFRLVAEKYGLNKADHNTHLYLSAKQQAATEDERKIAIREWQGRVFEVIRLLDRHDRKAIAGQQANVICRNYPLRADQLRQQLRLRDGGDCFVIGMRLDGKPTLLLCKKV